LVRGANAEGGTATMRFTRHRGDLSKQLVVQYLIAGSADNGYDFTIDTQGAVTRFTLNRPKQLNALNDAVSAGNRVNVGQKLDALIAYVAGHFKTEEDLFDAHGYPDAAAHKAKHADLVKTCLDVQKKFHNREIEITPDTCVFVKDWLYDHIPNVDKHYGAFLNSKGVK
jgi:hemerythrin